MSSPDNLFYDEALQLTLLCSPGSPNPYIPLLDCLENESIGLIPDSMDETNPLMSPQQSNLVAYQGISTLVHNPLEMQQQQQQVLQQQQLENSLELWLQENVSGGFLSQSMLNTFQESSVFTRNQTEISQVTRENKGFAHPTMTSSSIFPAPLLHGDRSDAFGSISQTRSLGSQNYSSYQTSRPVTSSVNMYGQQLPPMIFTGRQNEPNNSRMINNSAMTTLQPVNSIVNMYGRQQPTPSIFIPNEPHNLRMVNNPTMMPQPIVTSSVNMYGQQPPLPIFTGRQNEPHNLRMSNHPTMTPRSVITSSVNMYGQQPPPSIFTGRQNETHNLRMVNNPAMTFPLQNQTNIIPTFNLAPQHNIPSIPRPQVSSSFPRHLDGMQRSVNQSSSRLRFSNLNTPMQIIRPHANSIIPPPQDGVLGSKRRSYQNQFELGQSSSSAQRHNAVSGGQNITSAAINLAEQRQANNIYNPIYESLGLCVDPHLRNYFFMSTD